MLSSRPPKPILQFLEVENFPISYLMLVLVSTTACWTCPTYIKSNTRLS